MSDTPSPTPSEDNRRNTRDETMCLTIDRAMNNTEQSREDLMNSFTFFNKADFGKVKPKNIKTPHPDLMKSVMSNIIHAGQQSPQLVTPKVMQHLKGLSVEDSRWRNKDTDAIKVDCDGIEEEVLDEGNMANGLSRARTVKTGTNLRVDNFIEGEDTGDDISDGYVASFGEEKIQVHKTLDLKPTGITAIVETSDHAPSLSLDESSTDKLLMNFLADLQNEQNVHNDTKVQKRTERTEKSFDSENSIGAFIQKNKRNDEEVDFSLDGDEAALSLVDNSNKKHVKVVVNHDEFSEITKPESLDEIFQKKVNLVMDSEVFEDTGHVDPCKEASNIVFPGEIVAEETSSRLTNKRLLDFKVIYRNSLDTQTHVTTEVEPDETHSDEVEQFHLDNDFDYDNVVLTPKYSEADMERLKTILVAAQAAAT